MKIVSWNCRYGLTKEKITALFAAEYKADLYAIQEVTNNEDTLADFKDLGENQDLYGDHKEFEWNDKKGGDLGIAIFSKKYKIERISGNWNKYRYVVPYSICRANGEEICKVIHIWTKTADKNLNDSEDYIQQVIHACEDDSLKSILFPENKKAIWLGDFNSSLQLSQKRYKALHEKFLKIMDKHGYKSAWHLANHVEHGKERPNNRTFFQQYITTNSFFNDYIFINPDVCSLKKSSVAHFKQFIGISDHCPIMAELELK